MTAQARSMYLCFATAAALLTACGAGSAGAGTPASADSSGSGSPVPGAVPYTLIPSLEGLLPAQPGYPAASNCATLQASLQQTGGRLPSSVDADPANSKPDSQRIQSAIDACASAGGGAVRLVASGSNNAFLAGPIVLKAQVILWVDSGVSLFASRSPNDYDRSGANRCGDATPASGSSSNCNAFITANGASGSGIVGEGVIDGRGGAELTSGNRAHNATWWDLAIQTKASPALHQSNPRLVQVTNSANFTLYNITLVNSPNFHVATSGSDGFTAWGVKVLTPSLAYANAGYTCAAGTTPVAGTFKVSTCFQPELAKNTDAFDPGNSKHVTIAYSFISTGDDDIVPKAGSNGALSSNHLYAHNRFYYGHGMSIGSETYDGLNGMKVWDLVTDGMDSSSGVGLRIKSYAGKGGLVQNILYQNICMRRVAQPLVFDPYYSASTTTTAHLPSFQNILIQDFHAVNYPGATYNTGALSFSGWTNGSTTHPLGITLNNTVFDAAPTFKASDKATFSDVILTLGPNSTPLSPPGNNVVVKTVGGTAATLNCPDSVFVKFPSTLSPI